MTCQTCKHYIAYTYALEIVRGEGGYYCKYCYDTDEDYDENNCHYYEPKLSTRIRGLFKK